MRSLKPAYLLLGVILSLAASAPAAGGGGMGSEHFRIPVSTSADGGRRMASQHFVVLGTIGQVAGRHVQSSHFSIRSGYWAAELAVSSRRVFLPVVIR